MTEVKRLFHEDDKFPDDYIEQYIQLMERFGILIQANQSLLFLLNAACLAEKQQIPILQSLVDPIGARTHNIFIYWPTKLRKKRSMQLLREC
jgi:DNA phosphorothioation-dependent restriction protein DptG